MNNTFVFLFILRIISMHAIYDDKFVMNRDKRINILCFVCVNALLKENYILMLSCKCGSEMSAIESSL